MKFLKIIFSWWNSQTFGTLIHTLIFGNIVGKDQYGNKYYQNKNDSKRWVIYKGEIDASKISNQWYSWIHFTKNKIELNKKDQEKKKNAKQVYESLKNKIYEVKKLTTENKDLYGSIKPTEISKLIKEKENINIMPSMIQPVKEIKSLGKFKVRITLHSEIDAEIHILVESAETIQ